MYKKVEMAGGVGLEPTVRVLETRGLPLTDPPILDIRNYRWEAIFCHWRFSE